MPRARDEAADYGRAEGADAKKREAEHGMRGPGGVKRVGQEQDDGKREEAQDGARLQGVFAEYFQHVGKQRNARAEKKQADDIERVGVLFAIVGAGGDRRDISR